MKKILLPLVLVSALTSLGTVLTFSGFQKNYGAEKSTNQNQHNAAQFANYIPDGRLQAASTGVDFEAAATLAVPAVVHIKTKTLETVSNRNINNWNEQLLEDFFGSPFGNKQRGPQMGSGSGVVISADGYIVTNNHVVANADELTVTFDNRVTKVAKVIGTDPATDLALLKIDGQNLPYLNMANSDAVKLGQWVLAVGFPLTLDATVTAGIVSAKSRAIGINQTQANNAIESFIQTDAAVNRGNSGGALVNTAGELIGINSAIASPTGAYAGYSYAIPSNIVKKVAFDLMKYGNVQRGYLGVEIRDSKSLTPEEITEYGLDRQRGVYVNRFMDNSSAEKAGLKKGDIITEVNAVPINSVSELMAQVAMYKPGDNVGIKYVRNDKVYNSTVQLKNVDGNTSIVKGAPSDNILGATIRPLNASEKTKYKTNGLLVVQIGNGQLRTQTNLKNNFIITEVNDKPVTSVQELANAAKNGEVLYFSGFYPGNSGVYHYGIRLNN